MWTWLWSIIYHKGLTFSAFLFLHLKSPNLSKNRNNHYRDLLLTCFIFCFSPTWFQLSLYFFSSAALLVSAQKCIFMYLIISLSVFFEPAYIIYIIYIIYTHTLVFVLVVCLFFLEFCVRFLVVSCPQVLQVSILEAPTFKFSSPVLDE